MAQRWSCPPAKHYREWSCDDPFFFFIQTQNEPSQWHDYLLQSQHIVHISYYVSDIQSQHLYSRIHNLCNGKYKFEQLKSHLYNINC
jgi:hypothetical protein